MERKDTILGKIMVKITGLPIDFLTVLYDLIEKLAGNNGDEWLGIIKKVLRKEDPFVASESVTDHEELKGKWSRIYIKYFGINIDFSELQIPKKPDGDWWLIIVAHGMTPERIFQVCKKTFDAWKCTDKNLNEAVISDRSAKNDAYAVWVKANIEADEKFRNLSANDLRKQNHTGITLEERMLLEIFYFAETDQHLDISNWTLCAGSRYFNGRVPHVNYSSFDRVMNVIWDTPDSASDRLHSRQVVAL